MKKHHQYDIILAFIEGKPIQFFYHGKWCDWKSDESNFPEFGAYDWRIKPNHECQLMELAQRLAEHGWIHEANLLDEHLAQLAQPKTVKIPDREHTLGMMRKCITKDPMLDGQAFFIEVARSLGYVVEL